MSFARPFRVAAFGLLLILAGGSHADAFEGEESSEDYVSVRLVDIGEQFEFFLRASFLGEPISTPIHIRSEVVCRGKRTSVDVFGEDEIAVCDIASVNLEPYRKRRVMIRYLMPTINDYGRVQCSIEKNIQLDLEEICR